MFPSALFGTQPVELFGRIGSRTWYQVCRALTSTPSSSSTMFCVASPVTVASVATTLDEFDGCACAATCFTTTAQCPIFDVVSRYRCGYETPELLEDALPFAALAIGSARSAHTASSAAAAIRRDERGRDGDEEVM